jgi:glutathione S-transferase
MGGTMIALYYSPGACSLAPHVVLEELGIEFEPRRVALAEGEHLKPDYLAVNPRARVPALETEGEVYTEAPALLIYLAGLDSGSGLLPPAGTGARARCLEWLGWLSSTHHIAYAAFWRPRRFLPEGVPTEPLVAEGRRNIERGNAEIEQRIGPGWILGDDYSVADAYLLPFYRWGYRIGIDMRAECPKWSAWAERMLERPAVRRAVEREGISLYG